MGKDARFFTFPVELLRGAFTDKSIFCFDAISYALFSRCKEYDESPKEAFEFFGVHGEYDSTIKRGRAVAKSFPNSPLVSVNKDILFDFMNNPKTDFEIAVFCAFCGLRSIIGTKPFVKTNNGLLLARMFGFRSVGELEAFQPKPPYFDSYFSTAQKIRYQLTEKIIKNELCLSWGLKSYADHSRGFYASFNLEFETLVRYAENSRKSTLLKRKRETEKETVKKVKHQLKNG